MGYNSLKIFSEPASWNAGGHLALNNNGTPSTLFAFGINHKTAPVEVREKLFLSDAEVREFLALVDDKLPECLVLSTCNRTEIYGVTDSPEFDISYFKSLLIDFKGAHDYVRDEHFFELISCSACQQLFSVATSIDSKVIGDLQILQNQLSAGVFPIETVRFARESNLSGRVFNELGWGGFLLHAWPEQRVFIDGQTDFYGETQSREYVAIRGRGRDWEDKLRSWNVEYILLPPDAPLIAALDTAEWQAIYRTITAHLIRRVDTIAIRQ